MNPLSFFLVQLIGIFKLAIFVWFVLSLLIYFKIVNPYQPLVARVNLFLNQLIEPVLKPIRKYLPPVNGLDISPVILIILLQTLEYTLIRYT